MTEAVVSFVLDQLALFLREEARLLGGLGDNVQFIKNELHQMKAFLEVAEAIEDDDPRLQVWIKLVREAAYDAEDVLQEFVSRFASTPSTGGLYGFVRRTFKSRTFRARVAREIQSIKSNIEQISDSHRRYQHDYSSFTAVNHTNTGFDNRDDALLVEEAKLVGIEEPKQHLIRQLINGLDSQFKVISVVGIGGLGKTTLLKKVHEDADVRMRFPVRAWVTVSRKYDFEELLRKLIRLLHEDIKKPAPEMIPSMSSVELKECVKNFLQQEGRYAIVFDDVCDKKFWSEIKFALPDNCGSRVMLTTRNVDVASASCIEAQDHHIYEMKLLPPEESWTLFCNKVFRNDSCPEYLHDVAQDILFKCGGLPLAIVAVSGFLALKDVNRQHEWKMVQRSLRGEVEGTGMMDKVRKILFLSYNDLPSQLKACLLYLCIFPEDYEIGCHRLIQLWIAERFVEQREGMEIEDVAWDNLRELTNRSLIQVTKVLYEGMPETCRIHDILREVIISKSREQNLVRTQVTSTGQLARWPTEKVRRLVIYSGRKLHPNSNSTHLHSHYLDYRFDHIRSFITFGSMEELLSKTLLSKVLYYGSSKKLLKVLDLMDAQMLEEIPDEIFNLFNLNYLSLFRTSVKKVPKSIGNLRSLEILNLGETQVRKLPVEILKLHNLRHLLVFESYLMDGDYKSHGFKAPIEIGELVALQELCTIDIAARENKKTSSTIMAKEIGKLRELRVLWIGNVRREDGKDLCSSLANLTHLRQLSVSSTENHEEVIDLDHHLSLSSSSSLFLQSLRMLQLRGRLEKMPQWITCLKDLARIELMWSGLRVSPLESLQSLPNLVLLNLSQAYLGEELCFRSGGFPKLKELWLKRLEGLKCMKVEKGAMPCIQELYLLNLPLIEELSLSLQDLTQLHKLQLEDVNSKLEEDLRRKREETHHIHEIIIVPRQMGVGHNAI